MYYLTLINETDHAIDLTETHDTQEAAEARRRAYELTAELNSRDTGKAWRAVLDDKPFEWPVEPVEPS